jgi:hypothetical protein
LGFEKLRDTNLPNRVFWVGKATDAKREQIKTFQSRGVVIIVLGEADLKQVAAGENFITMLRRKYEKVRLDLRKELL